MSAGFATIASAADSQSPLCAVYGLNQSAQCGWTTHGWQELSSGPHDQAFKKNLSVALADLVSFRANCNATGFVMVPVAIFAGGKAGLPADWGLQLDAFEETIAPYVRNGSATGIFMGDEKICGGVPHSNYTAVLAHLRAAFGKSVLLYGNECSHTIGNGQLPAELDLFSFDGKQRSPFVFWALSQAALE